MTFDNDALYDYVRQVAMEVMAQNVQQPGGDAALEGFDPNHLTNPQHSSQDITPGEDSVVSELNHPVNAGETISFDFQVPLAGGGTGDQVTGVKVTVPQGGTGGGFNLSGPGEGGSTFNQYYGLEGFNASVGRVLSNQASGQSVLHIKGIYYNGPQPGTINVTYGEPSDYVNPDGSGPIITGDDTLSLDTKGKYLVTVHASYDAHDGDALGASTISIVPSLGPVNSVDVSDLTPGGGGVDVITGDDTLSIVTAGTYIVTVHCEIVMTSGDTIDDMLRITPSLGPPDDFWVAADHFVIPE